MTTAEYNQCVEDYADNVYRFILKNIKDEDKARDVVQDAFVKMWDRVGSILSDKAKSYLFTTAYHTMIDHIRKNSRMVEMENLPQDYASEQNNYSDLQEILNEAVSKLPAIQRSVVLLRDYEGYSYKEIGDIAGLNEAQVKVYIYRARMFLRKYIGSMESVV